MDPTSDDSRVHLIKGNAFVTVREWLTREHPARGYEALLEAMPAEHRMLVADPTPSVWHPEAGHRSMLHALDHVICNGDPVRFHRAITGATQLGVHKFARLILQMSSNAFVLRRLPTLWRVIRRGPATTVVDQDEERTRLTYTEFPFFADPLYRRYIVGVLTGVVLTSGGAAPRVDIVEHGVDSMVAEVRLGPQRPSMLPRAPTD